MTFVVDIDGVLCKEIDYTQYASAVPIIENIVRVKNLSKRHTIILHTSRPGCDRNVTEEWLRKQGIHYDVLVMGKPLGDVYVDDKAVPIADWLEADYYG